MRRRSPQRLFLTNLLATFSLRFISGGSQLDEAAGGGRRGLAVRAVFSGTLVSGPRHDGLPEACQHDGVDPVGLGEDAERFGEVANLSGVDDRNLMARVDQFGDEGPLVTAGRFHDDQTLSGRRKLLSELPSALGIVSWLERRSLRQHVHVEGPFGDVDTDEVI